MNILFPPVTRIFKQFLPKQVQPVQPSSTKTGSGEHAAEKQQALEDRVDRSVEASDIIRERHSVDIKI